MPKLITKAEFNRMKDVRAKALAKAMTTTTVVGVRKSVADTGEHIEITKENISIVKYLKGGLSKDWTGAETEKSIYDHRFNKVLVEGNESLGGLFVPAVIVATIEPRLKATSVWRSLGCQVSPISGFRSVTQRLEGTLPTITHDNEASTLTEESAMDFDKGTIENHRMTCLKYLSVELNSDADMDIENTVRTSIADAIANDEDIQMFRGLGGTQALGLLYQPRVNSTDLSGEIDQDDITNAAYQVTKAHSTITAWVGDYALGWKITKLKDAEGRYLFPQTGQHANLGSKVKDLGGIPLHVTGNIGVGLYPGSTSGTVADETFLIGGDWSKYRVLDGTGLMVMVTDTGGDAFAKGLIGMRVMKYFGGAPIQPAAFVVVKGITGT